MDAERSEGIYNTPFVANGDIQNMSFSVNNAFEPVGLKRTSLFNVVLFNLRLLKFSEIFFISFHLYENVRACLCNVKSKLWWLGVSSWHPVGQQE